MKWLALFLALISSAAAEKIPVLNQYILAAMKSMPRGGGYEASPAAVTRLHQSTRVTNSGVQQNLKVAGRSFCSGATYSVFLKTLESLQKNGALTLDQKTKQRLSQIDVKDGENIFGRWNANGPGTARLFTELKLGSNFTSYEAARPGDFMKIWWTQEIGSKERGHLVIYLGGDQKSVRFWSSNQPGGYGEKTVPRSKIKRALFSRFTHHKNLTRATKLSSSDKFLADMLRKRFTWSQVVRKCQVQE